MSVMPLAELDPIRLLPLFNVHPSLGFSSIERLDTGHSISICLCKPAWRCHGQPFIPDGISGTKGISGLRLECSPSPAAAPIGVRNMLRCLSMIKARFADLAKIATGSRWTR
ncbi:hypothetical protein [Stutzerimonas nitrititolerans]|uniref:hypothetical protein n=1 Tax=Stutzerimonas nitrititolerans TaxID=2482751 RepID=UPI0028999D07|nr:hypothetical protein [Stutzerimonas nitrititolerans]